MIAEWLDQNVFKGRRNGIFVDAGAGDGISNSNTLFFEMERAWDGLLIEPIPEIFARMAENRPLPQKLGEALWKSSGVVEFDVGKNRIPLPASTLTEALDGQAAHIDYLSLDIEGAEYPVLHSYDWLAHEIEVITVEDKGGNPLIRQLLTDKGYRYIKRLGSVDVWRLASFE